MTRLIRCFVWVALLQPTHAVAQQADVPVGAKAILARFETTDEPVARARLFSEMRRLLQQELRDVPTPLLDSIADGLVRIAMERKANDLNEASDAVTLLRLAGSNTARRPYLGSFSRLKHLYENCPHLQGPALSGIGDFSDRKMALRYLETVATAGPPTAYYDSYIALRMMAHRFGEEGLRAIARLDREGIVRHGELRLELQRHRASGYRTLPKWP